MENNSPVSLTKCAMEYGLYMSVYLLILFLCFINSQLPFMGTLLMALFILVPFILYKLILRYALLIPREQAIFSHLWLFGILLMVFASIPTGLVQYIYHQYINPEWFGQQIEIMKTSFASIENPDKFLSDLKQQLDLLIEPTAIELTVQYMWLTAFLGTFASLLAALFAVSARRRKPDIRL